MVVKVVFKQGEPREIEGDRVSDFRLTDRSGRAVVTDVRQTPKPYSVLYVRDKGVKGGLIARIHEGQSLRGDDIGLPNVDTITKLPHRIER